MPTIAAGSRAAIATATPSAWAIEMAGSGSSSGRSTRVSRGRPCSSVDDRQVGRIDRRPALGLPDPRAASLAAIRPQSRCDRRRSEPPRARCAARSAGPSWVCSRTSRQTGRPMSAGGSSQTAFTSGDRTLDRIVQRQLFADEDIAGLAEDVAVAARPVEPPVFPVLIRIQTVPSGRTNSASTRMRCRSSSRIAIRQCDIGADRRPIAEELKFFHAEREHDVAIVGEIVEAPAAEQLREVIDHDQVGVQSRRLARPEQRLPGQHAQQSRRSRAGDMRPTSTTAWRRRSVEEPLLVVDRLGRESAGACVLQDPGGGRWRSRGDCVEDRDRLEDRPGSLRPAVRAPVEDADPDSLVIVVRLDAMPAKLQADGLLLVAHPFVGSNLSEAGEDQSRRDHERGRLRGHLGHHGERQDGEPHQRRVEGRDLAAAQRVVLRDRIVIACRGSRRPRSRIRRSGDARRRPRDLARAREGWLERRRRPIVRNQVIAIGPEPIRAHAELEIDRGLRIAPGRPPRPPAGSARNAASSPGKRASAPSIPFAGPAGPAGMRLARESRMLAAIDRSGLRYSGFRSRPAQPALRGHSFACARSRATRASDSLISGKPSFSSTVVRPGASRALQSIRQGCRRA